MPDDQQDSDMDVDIASRLAELRSERDRGEQMLAQLETEVAEVRSQLLRISGAIQVLEELSGETAGDA